MPRTLLALTLAFACCLGGTPTSTLAQFEAFELTGENEGEERELETDRDAFTPATSTAGFGLTIVESSYSFIDNRAVAETHSFPELLVRHGLSEIVELCLGWNYEVGGTGDLVGRPEAGALAGEGIERESQLLYGLKLAATEQAGWVPRSAVILQGYTPTSGEATQTDFVATYAFGWQLDERWQLDSSIRYGTEQTPEESFNLWAPSVVLRAAIDEQWHAHIEYFAICSQGAEDNFTRHLLSPGMHYMLTPNLELGARVGWGLTPDAPHFFSNVGLGWRF
jgi:hypothetical protein